MFIREFKEKITYYRRSKNDVVHAYYRHKTRCVFRCDSCDAEFIRSRSDVDHKRLNNNYFHVCSNCDTKRFAQRKGVERKQIWNMSASSDLPIGKL